MNWSQYNKNLVKRESINLWLSENITQWWHAKESKKRGRPHVYTNRAIETCLTIGYLFNMPLRMVEGFLNSFFEREQIPLKSPCYTQLSRRATQVKIPKIKVERGQKLHLALDIETRYIAETSLTRNSVDDAEVAVQMLTNKFDGCVERVIGDGAYDKGKVYKAARKIGANLITPPARNAKQQRTVIDPAKLPRDNAIARIRAISCGDNDVSV